jgi:rhamnosyltransferase
MKKNSVSVVIRTKNEADWIASCIDAIRNQNYECSEIIVVDNNSSDGTRQIAKEMGATILDYQEHYLPGSAINRGLDEVTSEFAVILSAHCIPADSNWLGSLIMPLLENNNIAASYGRQIPTKFSDNISKRDLLTTFGIEDKIQKKDYFFHNANSCIRISVWKEENFSEVATNVEDRIWAKDILSKGFYIYYSSDASVYHYHGLHQNNENTRLNGVVGIIENLDTTATNLGVPRELESCNTKTAILFTSLERIDDKTFKKLEHFAKKVKDFSTKWDIFYLTPNKMESLDLYHLAREKSDSNRSIPLNEILVKTYERIESVYGTYRNFIYANPRENNIELQTFIDISTEKSRGGFDNVFYAKKDYGQIWKYEENKYENITQSLADRNSRKPFMRANYGKGLIISSSLLRLKKVFGIKVGIISDGEIM